jgi:hypothetical protein
MTVNVQRQSSLKETLGQDAGKLLAAAAVYQALNWNFPDPASARKRMRFAGGSDLNPYDTKRFERRIEQRVTPGHSVRRNITGTPSCSVKSTPRENPSGTFLPAVNKDSARNLANTGTISRNSDGNIMASPSATCASSPRRGPKSCATRPVRLVYSTSTTRTTRLPARSVDVATRRLLRTNNRPDSPTYRHLPTANRYLLASKPSCSTPTGLYRRFQQIHAPRNSGSYPFQEINKKVKPTLQEPSCFTISFRNNSDFGETGGYYDPCSEMNSDYYTVQKVYTHKKLASIPQLTTLNGLLSGKAKILHGRRQDDKGSITSTTSSPRNMSVV